MKIHIDIQDDTSPTLALECVRHVINDGRVSQGEHGKMYYCWATTFTTNEGELLVLTRQYRKSDCFIVRKTKKTE
jgi:hypothetical protein